MVVTNGLGRMVKCQSKEYEQIKHPLLLATSAAFVSLHDGIFLVPKERDHPYLPPCVLPRMTNGLHVTEPRRTALLWKAGSTAICNFKKLIRLFMLKRNQRALGFIPHQRREARRCEEKGRA